ncbi:MAG: NUDIX domain-containing protein [Sphingomonas sp.]
MSATPSRRTALSAGILLFHRDGEALTVLLVHPGGPFWRRRDVGAWQLPKGQVMPGEAPIDAARREFAEELGAPLVGDPLPLGRVRQRGGKTVEAFAVEGRFDVALLQSNSFEVEWPPRSGRMQSFPEVDMARWFTIDEAREMMLPSHQPFLGRLLALNG